MGFSNELLSGKRILVTGAGRGIGRCCALMCASLGADVIAVARTEDELLSLVGESGNRVEAWVEDGSSQDLID